MKVVSQYACPNCKCLISALRRSNILDSMLCEQCRRCTVAEFVPVRLNIYPKTAQLKTKTRDKDFKNIKWESVCAK